MGDLPGEGCSTGAHLELRQCPGLLLAGDSSAALAGHGAGYGLWGWRGAAQAKGLQAASALMHLLIVVYTSGYNLAITLPESIKDFASNIGASFS